MSRPRCARRARAIAQTYSGAANQATEAWVGPACGNLTCACARISVAMNESPARPPILISGVLLALFDLAALLPGNPVVTRASGFAVVVAGQALIIWRLWHRSTLAWFFWVFLSADVTAGSILVGGPYETTLVVTSLLMLMQVGLLCSPP